MSSGSLASTGQEGARWSTTLTVVAAASLPGLAALAAVGPVATAVDEPRGLVEYVGLATAWNLAVLGLLVVVVAPRERRSFGSLVRAWWAPTHDDEVVRRPVVLWCLVGISAIVGMSPIRLALIDAVWSIAPGPSWSVNSPSANEGVLAFSVPAVVVVFQVLVRIPLTVFVEESLFRGWVQQRHGAIASALLFAAYHLAQWWTIPALVPFALALSLLRVVTRSIWPGAALHAVGNTVYALTLA